MKAFILAAALALLAFPALGQVVTVAPACSAQNIPLGYNKGQLIQKPNGDLCVATAAAVTSNVVSLDADRANRGDQTSTFSNTIVSPCVFAGAGPRDITSLTLANSSATNTTFQLLNDDGTTIRWTAFVPLRSTVFVPFIRPLNGAGGTWKCRTLTAVSSVTVTATYVQ